VFLKTANTMFGCPRAALLLLHRWGQAGGEGATCAFMWGGGGGGEGGREGWGVTRAPGSSKLPCDRAPPLPLARACGPQTSPRWAPTTRRRCGAGAWGASFTRVYGLAGAGSWARRGAYWGGPLACRPCTPTSLTGLWIPVVAPPPSPPPPPAPPPPPPPPPAPPPPTPPLTPPHPPSTHAQPPVCVCVRAALVPGAQVTQCLRRISGMSTAEVMAHYGFVEELPADNLRARATGGRGAGGEGGGVCVCWGGRGGLP
jgi:hypothetical protein